MLQLYVLYFLLPRFGVKLDAWVAGIAGLAINYSAYEAEIYRAGLQAIPPGQMEAALALGMSRGAAIRLVIVPQAVRIVIPPVTNDFIALFKDTSVCSAITLIELTKRYYIEANSTGYFVELGITAAVLYMLMSCRFHGFPSGSRSDFPVLRRRANEGVLGMIEACTIIKKFGPRRSCGASLKVAKGEVAVIVGASGGGKSTFLRCLNGLEYFDSGTVVVDGLVLAASLSPRERAQVLRKICLRMGMVFQSFNLFPHWNALKNVAAAPMLVLGLSRDTAEDREKTPRSRRHGRPARRTTGEPLGRPTATSGDRPRTGHGTGCDPLRRAHERLIRE